MGVLHLLRDIGLRVFRPVTAVGRAVAVTGVAAWVLAAAFGWTELAVVAGACLLGVVIGLLFTFGRMQLTVRTVLSPKRVIVGERAVAEFNLVNSSSRRMLPLRVELPIGPAVAEISVPSLGAGDDFEETIVIPTMRRSVLAVGPTRSVRGDPLGLMRREVAWTDVEELFVHPQVTNLVGLTSGWLRDLEGRPTNDRSPSDVAFHTLREYVPGDDRRHVHWRTSARIGKLMVRQFIDNRRSHLGLVLDTNPASYADADEFELAVSMVASLGLRAIRDGQETSCVAGSTGVNAHMGQTLLDGLCRVELGVPVLSMSETSMRAAPMMTAASVIAIVTGAGLSVGELQLARQRFGTESQLIGVRAAFGEKPGFTRGTGFMTVQADSLDTFRQVLVAMVNP
jgi:uncharacterized protein (DUF58 family)